MRMQAITHPQKMPLHAAQNGTHRKTNVRNKM
jgi:hypothetical protein